MVKKGPCLHCRINSTPLWRNGPVEKPILCNACGSRYKQKGHLDNYLPKNVQLYSHPRLNNSDDSTANGTASDLSVDDKLSDHEDSHTGEVNEDLLKSKIPSKKRSLVVYERGTAMERFQKQLVSLYRRSPPAPEDVLLKDSVNNVIIPENEIGLGGILLKPPPACADATPTDEGSSSSKCPPKN